MEQRTFTCLGGHLLAGGASLETVLGTAADVLEVAHAAGTGGLSALSLLAPLVGADLGRGVTARSANLFLTVEGTRVASSADGVRLGAVESKSKGVEGMVRKIALQILTMRILFARFTSSIGSCVTPKCIVTDVFLLQ